MRIHSIVIYIHQPYSTLSFGMLPWINPIAPIQPVSRAPMARPHKSIPSPRSSSPTNQFHCPDPVARPPWHTHINQCHRPVPASVAHPHKSIPSPRLASIQAPMNQTHRPDPARVTRPHCVPLWINPIALIQPVSHGPMASPHESY